MGRILSYEEYKLNEELSIIDALNKTRNFLSKPVIKKIHKIIENTPDEEKLERLAKISRNVHRVNEKGFFIYMSGIVLGNATLILSNTLGLTFGGWTNLLLLLIGLMIWSMSGPVKKEALEHYKKIKNDLKIADPSKTNELDPFGEEDWDEDDDTRKEEIMYDIISNGGVIYDVYVYFEGELRYNADAATARINARAALNHLYIDYEMGATTDNPQLHRKLLGKKVNEYTYYIKLTDFVAPFISGEYGLMQEPTWSSSTNISKSKKTIKDYLRYLLYDVNGVTSMVVKFVKKK